MRRVLLALLDEPRGFQIPPCLTLFLSKYAHPLPLLDRGGTGAEIAECLDFARTVLTVVFCRFMERDRVSVFVSSGIVTKFVPPIFFLPWLVVGFSVTMLTVLGSGFFSCSCGDIEVKSRMWT